MSPARVLLEELAAARQAGGTFEAAFPAALAVAVASAPRDERTGWRHAFCATRDSWRYAWLRQAPTRADRALALLGDSSDRIAMPERPCARCGEEIPADRRRVAKFCSDGCRRAAHEEHAHAAVV